MKNTLVIVESPAKAKTIAKYLGKGYTVESSIGHIRDLPKGAAEIPEAFKKEPWSRLGLNVDSQFEPLYVVSAEKKQHVARLKKLVSAAAEVILATDDDREGESIAWHLLQELSPKVPVKRMVFHEITKEAIQKAIQSPRDIDTNLVEAQETRRALDRLYGYEVSPLLWKKVAPKLSAGRVQSVATRMLVVRERERMAFVSSMWHDILLQCEKDAATFPAKLVGARGKKLASGKDFDAATGALKANSDVLLPTEADTANWAKALQGGTLSVISAEEKPFSQKPPAPFITSTLQQEGARKLGMGAAQTMRVAQKLYEGGYITYMRTDSTNLSKEAVEAARRQAAQMYGEAFVADSPRVYSKKSKNAQEAHEAIRPAGSSFRFPKELRGELAEDEWRLYDLIWKRTMASQMADARGRSMRVRLGDGGEDELVFASSGRTIDFAGFLRAYVEGSDDPAAALEDRESHLPELKEGQSVAVKTASPESHQTQPPSRFTEASLVQELEKEGIGRPSTYASIIDTIQRRGYANKKGQALVPSWTAFAISQLMEQHFSKLVDYSFTAQMEDDLDSIAAGQAHRVPYLQAFYFDEGERGYGLHPRVQHKLGEIDARAISTVDVPKLRESGIELHVGRFGPYLQRGDEKSSLPEDLVPDELDLARAEEALSNVSNERVLGHDPEGSEEIRALSGRYGPYVASFASEASKPSRTASLFPTDSLAEMTLERALQLLSLPRLVGQDENGAEIWAHNGRFGPYIKRGGDSRSLATHDQLFSLTVQEALAVLAQPRFGGRSAAPLATYPQENGPDILLKKGRFGPYLTDGEKNATLRKGEDEEHLTPELAAQIMAERGKEPKRKAKKGPSKATKTAKTRKKAAAKPASKKATSKASKEKIPWETLRAFLPSLDPTAAKLLEETRGKKRPITDVAAELGLELSKAKGMSLQASKKLNAAARAAAEQG